MRTPCAQCPWRLANQGKRHPSSFYTKANLRRLWNELRRGGVPQSCHLTDPAHPDHVAAGAPLNARPQECPGSVVVVSRELLTLARGDTAITTEHIDRYLAERPRGLTRSGLRYWLVLRASQLAGTPLGANPLPVVDVDDPAIGLPAQLRGGPC